MNRKIKKIFSYLSLALLLVFASYFFYALAKGVKSIEDSFKEDLPTTSVLTKEDSTTLNGKFLTHIKEVIVRNSKIRAPISKITFDNKSILFSCTLDSIDLISLRDSIIFQFEQSAPSTGVTYSSIEDIHCELKFKSGEGVKSTSLLAFLDGDSIMNLLNSDSCVCYYANCRSFALQNNHDTKVFLYFAGRYQIARIIAVPVYIIFVKEGRKIRLLIFTGGNLNTLSPLNVLDLLANS